VCCRCWTAFFFWASTRCTVSRTTPVWWGGGWTMPLWGRMPGAAGWTSGTRCRHKTSHLLVNPTIVIFAWIASSQPKGKSHVKQKKTWILQLASWACMIPKFRSICYSMWGSRSMASINVLHGSKTGCVYSIVYSFFLINLINIVYSLLRVAFYW
jgi:hypothetical protein